VFRAFDEWRRKSREQKALSAKMKVERQVGEASVVADERKLLAYPGDLRSLANYAQLAEADVIVDAVRFARARHDEFRDFVQRDVVDARPLPSSTPERRLHLPGLPGEPWVWQVTLVLYLFTILMAFMIGMLYSPALTVAVAVVNLAVMFLSPSWGVVLSLAVIVVALVNVL
jgi:hypothetical protein